MKNDIRLIKNDLAEQTETKKSKESQKNHQKALKDNLTTEIIRLLEYAGQTLLYILENKHDIILNAIKTTQDQEQTPLQEDDLKAFNILADEENQTHKFLTGKEKPKTKNNDISSDDYNYLYDCFFSIYSKIEREESKRQKLISEERQVKLIKIITNIFNYSLDEASRQGVSKSQGVLQFKTFEARQAIYNSIKRDFEEKKYTDEEIKKAYNKALKSILEEYKYISTQAEPEQEPVRLHWVWKANIALDAIRAFFKHF